MTESRLASAADVDAVTAAMVTAFATDPVWGDYSFPGAATNPEVSWPLLGVLRAGRDAPSRDVRDAGL